MLTILQKNKALRIIIILQCLVLSLQAQLTEFTENLKEYNQKTRNELVFMHIDREVYYPGDTIWFKALVRDKATLLQSHRSGNFFVYLVNDYGDVIEDAKFLTSKSLVKGQLPLDSEIRQGHYYVVGYSSWMKNFGVEEVFKKKIIVRYIKRQTIRMIPSYDKQDYFPGDTVNMEIKGYDELSSEVNDIGFDWIISSGGKNIARGNSTIYNSYDNEISFVVPEEVNEPVELKVRGDYGMVNLDSEFVVPVHFSLNVDFFPEGGQTLNGRMNRIAFEALYPNGMPASIEGQIVDENGNIVTTIASEHNGMGAFSIIPKKEEDYFLKIIKPSKIDKQFKLPEGKDRGFHMSARSNGNAIHVEIQNQGMPADTCLLALTIRGSVFYSETVAVEQVKNLTIPSGNLPSGIAVITLLDKNLLPRCERLLFVNYHNLKHAELTTGRQRFQSREKVTLNIEVTGPENQPVQGNYSLTVVDQKLGLTDGINDQTVYADCWFAPEIKERVLNPNYYFESGSLLKQHHLDLLLMTRGWRNYRYLDQIQNIDSLARPVNQDNISGKILKKRSILNPEPTKGKVTVFFGGTSKTIKTGEEGNFSFLPLYEGANPNTFLSATDEKGKDNVILQMDSNRYEKQLLNYLPLLTDSLNKVYNPVFQTFESLEKYHEWMGLNHYLLQPVTVTANRVKKEVDYEEKLIENLPDRNKNIATKSDLYNKESVYDVIMDMAEDKDLPIRINVATDSLEYYYADKMDGNPWVSIVWYINGFPTNMHPRNIYPGGIKELKLLTGPTVSFLFDRALTRDSLPKDSDTTPVVAYIITDPDKPHSSLKEYKMANRKVLEKYAFTKEFYKLTYDTPKKKNDPDPDMRKTIHWEPEVKLDSEGKATVTFYNADQYSKIKCILQGISYDGVPIYGESWYETSFMSDN